MEYFRTKDGVYGVKELEKQLKKELSDKIDSLAYDYEPELLPSLEDFDIRISVENDELVYEVSYSGPSEKYYGHLEIGENLGKIINQANTIEEVCDECVIIDNNHELPYTRPTGFDDLPKDARAPWFIGEVLGAIWTEWGLKYVAKLNEKGEWELL